LFRFLFKILFSYRTSQYLSSYTATITVSDDSDPFDGSLFLTLADVDGNDGNEVQLDLSGEMLRAGSKKQVDSVLLAVNGSMASVKVRTEKSGESTR